MKRERLTEAEAEMNDDGLYPLVDDMLNHRREMVKEMNNLFGLDVQVEFNSSWDYRIFQGESVHNVEEEVETSKLEVNDNGSESDGDETSVVKSEDDGDDATRVDE